MRSATLGALALAAIALSAGPAAAQARVQSGVLTCRGAGTVGFIVGSVHHLRCVFHASWGRDYRYHGIVRKFGLDVGITERSLLAWAVLAPTRRIGRTDLAGNYAGVSAGVAVGVGVGANALVGGSRNTIALQPLSVEGQSGVNLTLGVAGMELTYGR